jgi:hypothetical protein
VNCDQIYECIWSQLPSSPLPDTAPGYPLSGDVRTQSLGPGVVPDLLRTKRVHEDPHAAGH